MEGAQVYLAEWTNYTLEERKLNTTASEMPIRIIIHRSARTDNDIDLHYHRKTSWT
jgi:hypothetical protein